MILSRSIAVGLLLSLVLQLQTLGLCATLGQTGESAAPCCASRCCAEGDTETPSAPTDGDCSLCDMKDLLGKVVLSKPLDLAEEEGSEAYFERRYVQVKDDSHAYAVFTDRVEPPPLWSDPARSGVYLL